MAVVASLDVILSANVRKFQTGLKKAQTNLKSFAGGVAALGKSVGFAIGAGSAALAAVTAFGVGVRRAAADIDRLVDVGSKLGIDVNALRTLETVAAQTGVSTNQLELGLQRMTRRMAEAAKGTGEAQNALKELGLDAEALTAAGPQAAFFAVSDALRNVESQADKVRLAFKLFDSEGVNLVRTLGVTREEFDRLRKVQEETGGNISAVTSKAVKVLTARWEETKLAMSGLANTALTVALPALLTLAAMFDFTVKRTAALLAPLQKVGELLLPFATEVEESSDRATEAMKEAAIEARKVAAAIAFVGRERKENQEAWQQAIKDSENLVEEWKRSSESTLDELRNRLAVELTPGQQFLQDVETLNKLQLGGFIDAEERNELLMRSRMEALKEEEKIRRKMEEAEARRQRMLRNKELATIRLREREIRKEMDARQRSLDSQDLRPAALERGTQEAFAAFQATQRDPIVDKMVIEQRKARAVLEKLERRAVFLQRANIES